jgi:hypothetical protein
MGISRKNNRIIWLGVLLPVLAVFFIVLLQLKAFGQHSEHDSAEKQLKYGIPESLKHEHEELHEELNAATKVTGSIGEAAKNVATALHPHFVKEEELAMPQLGLLLLLARGELPSDIKHPIAMTEKLKAELPRMLEEHKSIVAALQKLKEAARLEKKPQYERYADKLMLHAQMEEEVLYPAAILIGEYLKEKSAKGGI